MTTPSDPSDGDRLDDLLVQAARDYNLPRAIPREEMWAKIATVRRQASVAPSRAWKGRRVWARAGVGVAAALLLTTGIMIGRRIDRDRPDGGSAQDPIVQQLQEETQKTRATALAMANSSAGVRGSTSGTNGSPTTSLAYQLVVMRHLAGSEAMITSFRASARRGERDSTMAEWSRELLGTTRTLEASRAADDPMMRRLLDDLDLVLSQIVRYTTKGTNDSDELNLIEQSIDRRGVITKLRRTFPVRALAAGS